MDHKGHEVNVASWGKDGEVWNIAVVCEECYEVIVDSDVSDQSKVEAIRKKMENIAAKYQ